jgi:hypothetical protein
LPSFHHARVEPFADETQHDPISYPLVKHRAQLSVVDGVEGILDTLPTTTSVIVQHE